MFKLCDLFRRTGRYVVFIVLIALIMASGGPASAQGTVRVFFLHHSTGQNLIEQGGVREGLTALGYEFYDHGYNGDGLRLADGTWTGENYDVPGDNTDPDGFAEIFAQPLHDPPDNTFSHMMQYDVIAFKSCFPTSNIASDEQLADYQSYYLAIRDRIDQFPDKIFIVVTPPPQVPNSTDAAEGRRARAFADWLSSDEYLAGHPNIFTFNFFDLLAGDDNFLRPEYRMDEWDAHPNERANRDIGPIFVDFIDQAIQSYDLGEPRPEPVEQPAPSEEEQPSEGEAEQPAPSGAAVPATGLIADFEAIAEPWHTSSDRPESVIECGGDSAFSYNGAASLRVHYEIAPDGWADCGTSFDPSQDWSGGGGLSFWLLADTAGEDVSMMIFSGPPDNPNPYETVFQTTEQSVAGWTQFVFAWEDFALAQWADADAPPTLDATRVTGYAFSFGAGSSGRSAIFWMDDLGLTSGAGQPAAPAAEIAPQEEETAPQEGEAAPEELPDAPQRGGGVCSGAAALPLGVIGLALVSRRRS